MKHIASSEESKIFPSYGSGKTSERVFKTPLENGENLKGDSEECASGKAWQHKQNSGTKKVCLYKNRSVFHSVNTSGAITRNKTLPEEPEIERKLRLSIFP